MRLVTAFFRMVRWPNLVFIALTQLLFYFCIYTPLYNQIKPLQLFWLIVSSVFIAAGGYIINDYFDLNIDQINKPEKNVINAVISRRWAIFWHLALSSLGLLATVLAVSLGKWYLILANLVCILLLWFYSTSLKRRLLIGNVAISVLTAWTVLILFFAQVPFHAAFRHESEVGVKFFRVSFLYAGFAFIISLIREAVKDMEDIIGDERYGCTTLPIVAGIRAAKIYVAVWTVVLMAALFLLQVYILQFGWYAAVAYSLLLVLVPLYLFFRRLLKARQTVEFAQLSRWTKMIMLTGILSMIFFRLYF